MEDKDKVDALIKLAELQQKGIDKRRDIEWKMSTVLWTAIFVGTGFILDHKNIKINYIYILIFYSVFFILYTFLIGLLGRAHKIDKKFRHKFRSEAVILTGIEIEPGDKSTTASWIILEIILTFLFLCASGCLIILYNSSL